MKTKNIKQIVAGLIVLISLGLFIYLYFEEIKTVVNLIRMNKVEEIESYISHFKTGGMIVLFSIIFIQVIFSLPMEISHIAASLCFGIVLGFFIAYGALLVASSLIYVSVKFLKLRVKQEINESEKKKNLFLLVLALYCSPIIPYGAICYFLASRNKMRYWKFILITAITCIPSIAFNILSARLIINLLIFNNYWLLVMFVVGVLVLALGISYYNTSKKVIREMTARTPNYFLYYGMLYLCFFIFKIRNRYKIDSEGIKDVKGPIIMLSSHPSRPDFVYSLAHRKRERFNVVVNRYYFYNTKAKFLLDKVGAIPKDLFNHDIQTIRMILKSVKDGRSILMMPEGRLSSDGETEKITEGTAKLIKKLNIPVVAVRIQGAHYCGPKWATNHRRGQIYSTAQLVFDKDECLEMDEKEIEDKIAKALYYNDSNYVKEHSITYKSDNFAQGIDGILYRCPSCEHEFTLTTDINKVKCSHCSYEVGIDNKYLFTQTNGKPAIYDTIDKWFRYQIAFERKYMEEHPDFELRFKGRVKMPNPEFKGLGIHGYGECILNKEGIRYIGTIYDKEENLFFPVSTLPGVAYGAKEGVDVYRNQTYYYFLPDDIMLPIKWSIVGELNYEINGEKNEK